MYAPLIYPENQAPLLTGFMNPAPARAVCRSPRPMAMDSNYSSPMGEPLMEALEEEEEDSGPPTPFFDLLPPEPKGECSEQAQETVSKHVGSMFLDPVAALTCGEGPPATHGWTVDQNATHQPPQEHVSSSVCCLTPLCVRASGASSGGQGRAGLHQHAQEPEGLRQPRAAR